ncbi:uncharacterized protein I206_104602 [Kwoniella pini CBS 10737]|uniref:Conidiation-specific protein 6 n=1 Tax=Kwoniella pini CBS 10737 TaxID=1296096 RepID=A0A1B9I7B1_9TREE|nr:uncharacterized protein I206_02136 [Kwoniella pini CBS 10737]OCF51422.1 hypothetical protein I206_02136 [Kwoniella pini CBS 10737]
MSNEHENRQLGGFKATLHNPNTSPEAKAHAASVLAEHGLDVSNDNSTTKASIKTENHVGDSHNGHSDQEGPHYDGKDSEHQHRVLGGYKATLHNPNTSSEAKEHAKEVLKEGEKHEHHVIGGYKATLHNPNTSESAKEHAKEVLKEHHAEVA